jgi:hypothetical protein
MSRPVQLVFYNYFREQIGKWFQIFKLLIFFILKNVLIIQKTKRMKNGNTFLRTMQFLTRFATIFSG